MKNKEMVEKEMNFFISFFFIKEKTIFVSNKFKHIDI